jgi:hypothetical protein
MDVEDAPVPAAPTAGTTRARPAGAVVRRERRSLGVGRGAARTLVIWCVGLSLAAVGLGVAADVVREPVSFQPDPSRSARIQVERTLQIPSVSWAPSAGARFYRVELFRAERRVLMARTRKTTFAPSGSWEPGGYRWLVRPAVRRGRRTRFGAPIVDVTVTARKAGA